MAHERDATADRVAVELAGRGVPVAWVNPSDFPARMAFTAEIGPGRSWSAAVTHDGRGAAADLVDVVSIYYRQPSQFQLADGMSDPEKVFAYAEARRGFGGVFQALDDCLWVNDPLAAARCEYKPVQLAAAVEVGLPIPETIITSDPQRAYEWARRLGRTFVYKTMGGIWHADEGLLRVIYTTPVSDPGKLLDPALSRTAHMFQAQIRKVREARALVVGDEVYTVAIDARSEQGRIDWRSDYNHAYEVIELPGDVRGKLIELHRRLGLVFGACDLALTEQGEWVLFETNQGGEWGWLATQGVPAAAALASILEQGTRWNS